MSRARRNRRCSLAAETTWFGVAHVTNLRHRRALPPGVEHAPWRTGRMAVIGASRPLPRVEPARHRATKALASIAILRRRRHPLSMRLPTIGTTFRRRDRSVNMAKSRHTAPNATIPEDCQNHDYRHTVPLRTHPTPLVRQQAVERRFGERKRNRRFRGGTSGAERDYDRRNSASL